MLQLIAAKTGTNEHIFLQKLDLYFLCSFCDKKFIDEPLHQKTNNLHYAKPKAQISYLTGWFVSDLVGNPDSCFSHAKAQIYLHLYFD